MFEKHKEKKAAEAHARALANWQAQRDGTAQLLQLAETFHGAATPELMLKPAEALFFKVTNVALVEERRGQGHYSGASSGVSIPIGTLGGHAVRYRVGTTRGHYVAGTPTPTAIDTGTVFITNQRVIFQGSKQTRECLFAKLIGFEHDDGAGATTFSVSNRQKPTVIHYGPALAGDFDFRLDLALAAFKGTQDQMVATLRTQLAAVEAAKPAPQPALA